MPLELDTRQRAMLREMGVHVWLPETMQQPDSAPLAQTADSAPRAKISQAPPEASSRTAPVTPQRAVAVPPMHAQTSGVQTGVPLAVASMDWDTLAQTAAGCRACGLCAGRKNATLQPPETPLQSDWLVLGDPPDEEEDRLGQPFAGQAGVLLDNMLKAVGARRGGSARHGAYVSSVVKCRPPNGRLPQMAELQQCAQYLQRELALVQPKLIVAMGRFATQLLLHEHPQEAALPLGKQRGAVYHYQGIPVVVTYHPKALMRTSADKAKAWADLCLAMDLLDGQKI